MRAHIDVETYSPVDLKQTGVYPYAEHPDTEVLCACWAVGEGPVQTWRWGGPPPKLPMDVEWWAYNAQFDATLWYHVLHKRCGWPFPGWSRFRCSMVSAAYANLPGKLAEVASALGTAEKDLLGAQLMQVLCRPAKETANSNDPKRRHTPEALDRLAAYCAQDVIAERALHKLLPELPVSELQLWQLDQTINRRGLYINTDLVAMLQRQAEGLQEIFREELAEVTNGQVTSETQLAGIISFCSRNGFPIKSGDGAMSAEAIAAYLRQDLPPHVRRVLELRQLLAKSSLAKLKKMMTARCTDGRLRGSLQFYGAHQTGRWAGRLIQPQNLPRGIFDGEAGYREGLSIVETADRDRCPEFLHACYGNKAMDALGALIRPCIAAPPGRILIVVDFSAVEARGLAWASGEEWRLEVFRGDGKIYEASAARTLGIPVESIKKGSKERGAGKVTELALGYQGGPQALEAFGAVTEYGIPKERLKPIVDAWRAASPAVVKFWYGLQDAAVAAIEQPGAIFAFRSARFKMVGPHLRMALPSGRNLWYRDARVVYEPAPWDPEKLLPRITFYGENPDGGWGLQNAYGGSLTNNFVQGLCRDLMAAAMLRAEQAGFPIILTVHDEIVAEVDDPGTEEGRDALVKRLKAIMCELPEWAEGFPVAADGFHSTFYHK